MEHGNYASRFVENDYPTRISNDSGFGFVMIGGYETESDIQAAFQAAGVAISSDQLRRWRDQGLMSRVKQTGLGRAAGSVIHYPSGTAERALEIRHLLAIKKKLSFVGWQLWMQGHDDVSEKYWKPAINSALTDLKRIPAFLRLMEMRNSNKNETIFDQIKPDQFSESPFSKGLARLSPDIAALSFGLLADVAKGNFAGNQSEQIANRRAISKLIGQSMNSTVAGIFPRANFESNLEIQLEAISHALEKIQKRPYSALADLTPQSRMDFARVLYIASQVNSLIPAFAKSPIGRFAKAIANDQIVQAHIAILWGVFRKTAPIIDSDKITEMIQNFALKSEN